MSKEHWKIKLYVSVLFLRTWRSGILFQPNITIFDIYMKGKRVYIKKKKKKTIPFLKKIVNNE